MPNYDCECQECSNIVEVTVPLTLLEVFDKQENECIRCPLCKGKLIRIISRPMLKLKLRLEAIG